MKIKISSEDLPFLRFIKRYQLFTSCLKKLSSHPMVGQLESGTVDQVELDYDIDGKEEQRIAQLGEWWDKAEQQGISTRLLNRLFHSQQIKAA